jgi:2-dehydropantoate 2-reductase
MRALIVGAGPVGQVFGHHLAKAGAEVSFLVKPKYADECRRGFTLHQLGLRSWRTERLTPAGVITEPGAAAGTAWDQIYVTVSSVALRAGGWFAELAAATGDATLVQLQPNPDDRAFVANAADPRRVVDGVIGFIAYHAPLPGETRFAEPGVAYWLPPPPSMFSGERAAGVAQALRRGRLRSKRVREVAATAPFQTALLYSLLAALEGAGWSLTEVRTGDHLRLACRGAAQAMAVAGHQVGRRAPWQLRFAARPFLIRIGLGFARRIIPLDLETYLRVHFTKLTDQTRDGFASYLAHGKTAGLPVDAIAELAGRVAA